MFNGIWEGMVTFFIVAMIAACGLGALAMWGIPKLWEMIKPLIHAATA